MLSKLYQQDAATRTANAAAMAGGPTRCCARCRRPPRRRRGRETDLAFDYAEHHHPSPDTVAQVLAVLERSGMRTTVSSIHIHGCFGGFNKWQGPVDRAAQTVWA